MVIRVASHTPGGRKNEDRYLIHVDKHFVFYALFDGHNGLYCAERAVELCDAYVKDRLGDSVPVVDDLKNLIKYLYSEFQHDPNAHWSGTTALLVIDVHSTKRVYVGNIGDSILLMFHAGSCVFSTKRHRLSSIRELNLITDLGYSVTGRRVNGILQPSRTLGDHEVFFKSKPPADIYQIDTSGFDSIVLLMMTDGVFDYLRSQDIKRLSHASPTRLHQETVQIAIRNGSPDDMISLVAC